MNHGDRKRKLWAKQRNKGREMPVTRPHAPYKGTTEEKESDRRTDAASHSFVTKSKLTKDREWPRK